MQQKPLWVDEVDEVDAYGRLHPSSPSNSVGYIWCNGNTKQVHTFYMETATKHLGT